MQSCSCPPRPCLGLSIPPPLLLLSASPHVGQLPLGLNAFLIKFRKGALLFTCTILKIQFKLSSGEGGYRVPTGSCLSDPSTVCIDAAQEKSGANLAVRRPLPHAAAILPELNCNVSRGPFDEWSTLPIPSSRTMSFPHIPSALGPKIAKYMNKFPLFFPPTLASSAARLFPILLVMFGTCLVSVDFTASEAALN